MKTVAVLLMGGVGSRFNTKKPKQFYLIKKVPLFIYCLQTFCKVKKIDEIILVINPTHATKVKKYLTQYKLLNKVTLINGSASRALSLLNAIKYVIDHYQTEVKIISHDVARAFVLPSIIKEHVDINLQPNEVISTVINCTDALLQIKHDTFSTVNRDEYLIMQTPQTFNARNIYDLIMNHLDTYNQYNDLCSFAIAYGNKNRNIFGSKLNFKVTTIEDIALLKLLNNK